MGNQRGMGRLWEGEPVPNLVTYLTVVRYDDDVCVIRIRFSDFSRYDFGRRCRGGTRDHLVAAVLKSI